MTVFYGANRRILAHVCGPRGRGKARKLCAFCPAIHEWLCDGCDKPICHTHATSIRPIDKDFCPDCMKCDSGGCAARAVAPQVECIGPGAEKAETGEPVCVAHSLVYTAFLRDGGFERVYSRKDLTLEQKRAAVREWVIANWPKLNPYLNRFFNQGDK